MGRAGKGAPIILSSLLKSVFNVVDCSVCPHFCNVKACVGLFPRFFPVALRNFSISLLFRRANRLAGRAVVVRRARFYLDKGNFLAILRNDICLAKRGSIVTL